MKRLRHPVRAIREPFGTAGLVVACIALIAALGGTALAAKGALTGKQKKEVEKIAKKFAGKDGAAGAPGANGTNGANGKDGAEGKQGPEGKAGANGTNGTNGTPGTPGTNGKSPKIIAEYQPGEPGCEENGGFVYEVEGSNEEAEVCNGKEGKDGSPWAVGGLPSGATETGTWAFSRDVETFTVEVGGAEEEVVVGDNSSILVPLSFPVPLASNLEQSQIHFTGDPGFSSACTGSANTPKANPGQLCIYVSTATPPEGTKLEKIQFGGEFAEPGERIAGKTGAIMVFERPTETEFGYIPAVGAGTFAVTAP